MQPHWPQDCTARPWPPRTWNTFGWWPTAGGEDVWESTDHTSKPYAAQHRLGGSVGTWEAYGLHECKANYTMDLCLSWHKTGNIILWMVFLPRTKRQKWMPHSIVVVHEAYKDALVENPCNTSVDSNRSFLLSGSLCYLTRETIICGFSPPFSLLHTLTMLQNAFGS